LLLQLAHLLATAFTVLTSDMNAPQPLHEPTGVRWYA